VYSPSALGQSIESKIEPAGAGEFLVIIYEGRFGESAQGCKNMPHDRQAVCRGKALGEEQLVIFHSATEGMTRSRSQRVPPIKPAIAGRRKLATAVLVRTMIAAIRQPCLARAR
jgi:hypothetical protein